MNTTFTQRRQIVAPRTVFPEVRKLAFDPTDRRSIDAFADRMLAEDRQREADIAAELKSEGRVRPVRPNPHDD